MPKIHLQQHRFTYIACGPFNKKKKRIKKNRIKKFKETGDSQYIYQNELQSVTKIVRLVPPVPMSNVGYKFARSFLATTAWKSFSNLDATLNQS